MEQNKNQAPKEIQIMVFVVNTDQLIEFPKLLKSKFTVFKIQISILECINFLDMDQTVKSGSEKLFLVQCFGIPFLHKL